jgi:hypothetical protein
MNKNFGVEFCSYCNDKSDVIYERYSDEDEIRNVYNSSGVRFPFISLEFSKLFEPQIDDLGITFRGDFCFYTGETWSTQAGYIKEDFVNIIFRNGKQFFMPDNGNF